MLGHHFEIHCFKMRSIFCVQPTCLKLQSYSKQFNSAGNTWMNKIQPSFGTSSYTYKGRWPVNKLQYNVRSYFNRCVCKAKKRGRESL